MKTTIKLLDGVAFNANSGSGHTITMDGSAEAGGKNQGARPMEMLLMGLGGCSAYDVVTILRKSRQNITDLTVEIEAKRAETDPKIFTWIHLHFKIYGENISKNIVERAINLSAQKYCSASIMLGKSAQITHDFEIYVPSAESQD
ncbi:MAG: OsmC family protein [Proteobacteria bacterium]|nr:OsmC family protein [Pseudomonadota bacterium]MDA1332210.1 OsmC family protein [Pseudomonadota bacterium]